MDWLFSRFPNHRLRDRVLPLNEIQTIQAGGEPFSFWLHQVRWTPSWQLMTQSGEKLSIWLEEALDLEKLVNQARNTAQPKSEEKQK
ncbi:MAG: hypothetical protein IV090_05605 [Candidatus Sericytochromatia bacterium]|nr:hypothetical protein [Candidatus Sericytochromatia bacterium]